MLFFSRIKENFKVLKYRCQRAGRGWSVKDTWSVYSWFSQIMPQMLEYLKENHLGFPGILIEEYLEAHGSELNMTYGEYNIWPDDKESEGYKLREKINETCARRWSEILDRMIFLLRETDDCTCTVKNPYEEEYGRIREEFTKKYGFFGEKLLKPEDVSPDGATRYYSPSDLPEYKDTAELYYKECAKIDEYRDRCKTEAIDLFNKWFWDLWD